MCKTLITLLKDLAKGTSLHGGNDTTIYGTGRAATRDFYPHHLAAISSALALAEARTLTDAADDMARDLTLAQA